VLFDADGVRRQISAAVETARNHFHCLTVLQGRTIKGDSQCSDPSLLVLWQRLSAQRGGAAVLQLKWEWSYTWGLPRPTIRTTTIELTQIIATVRKSTPITTAQPIVVIADPKTIALGPTAGGRKWIAAGAPAETTNVKVIDAAGHYNEPDRSPVRQILPTSLGESISALHEQSPRDFPAGLVCQADRSGLAADRVGALVLVEELAGVKRVGGRGNAGQHGQSDKSGHEDLHDHSPECFRLLTTQVDPSLRGS
jgi:hypothetical protein